MVVWFSVNQNEIGPDMAIAVITPLAHALLSRKRMPVWSTPDGFLPVVCPLTSAVFLVAAYAGERPVRRHSRQ
jgi:hypothetical protein